jgi:hypothetical protein
MRRLAPFAAIALVLATTGVHARGGVSDVTLTVRLYNSAHVSVPALLSARDTAATILADGGLHVVIQQCGTGIDADPCSTPLKANDVVVRVIEAPAARTSLHPDAFGFTYVAADTDRGWLATVFADRIGHASGRSGVAAGTLLGRVMAHEIGHLLLGSGYHGATGLMRAQWRDESLAREGQWSFSIAEAAQMQAALVSTETKLLRRASDKLVPFDSVAARR